MKRLPFTKQQNDYYCGPSCAKMVLDAFGFHYSQKQLAKMMDSRPRVGTARAAFKPVFAEHGLKTFTKTGANLTLLRRLVKEGWLPIVNYREVEDNIGHYAIVTKITDDTIVMHDPTYGPDYKLPLKVFVPRWYGSRARSHWISAAKKA